MTTTIDGLTGQTTTEPDDLIVIQNVAANRTRKIRYADFIAELTADMDIITSAQLASAIAGVTAAYQAADVNNLQKVFPVGSKITLVGSGALTNPSSSLGFGTWVKEEGKSYVGHKTGDATLGSVGASVGSDTHNHGGVTGDTTLNATQIPSHVHGHKDTFLTENSLIAMGALGDNETREYRTAGGSNFAGIGTNGSDYDNDTFYIKNRDTSPTGGSLGHNHSISAASNLPPSIVEVVWRRTA
jgi:hypothetical protein